jgi:uncharacterized repeat protein (TIGR02543 family)
MVFLQRLSDGVIGMTSKRSFARTSGVCFILLLVFVFILSSGLFGCVYAESEKNRTVVISSENSEYCESDFADVLIDEIIDTTAEAAIPEIINSIASNAPAVPEMQLFGSLIPMANSLYVSNETELIAAIAAAADSGEAATVVLTNNIETHQTITIPTGADITLAGDYELKRMNDGLTLHVYERASLTLDGITVTHAPTAMGRGITSQGYLHLASGSISGNRSRDPGAGVYFVAAETFTGYADITVTFTMSGGSIENNQALARVNAGVGGGVAIDFGTFNMTGGVIRNNVAEGERGIGGGLATGVGPVNISGGSIVDNKASAGGGVFVSTVYSPIYPWDPDYSGVTVFHMSGGEISSNEAITNGGGVYSSWTMKMTGGTIADNHAVTGVGGGIFNIMGDLTMTNGTISHNKSAAEGGGVWAYGSFAMSGGCISENESATDGGGVWSGTPLNISGSAISNNKAENGGGIYLDDSGSATISGTVISDNTATLDGGGIWADQTQLEKLSVASDVVFSSNNARMPYDRKPADDSVYAAQILGTSWTSPLMQGYNNYDISYEGLVINRSVSVTGGYSIDTGAGDYDFGTTIEIDAGVNPGFTFSGWTVNAGGVTLADASSAQTSFVMPAADVALTALWEPMPYAITYAAGTFGSGFMPEVVANANTLHTVLDNSFAAQLGYTFTHWVASGAVSGTYDAGDSFTVTGDVTLTAQWEPVVLPPSIWEVVFVDYNDVVLARQMVDEGTDAAPPQDPYRQGYTFTGWDTAFTNVTSNLTIKATYVALPTYAVTFAPGDHGSFASQVTTDLLAGVSTPAAPQTDGESGWQFSGWLPALAPTVTGDVTYTAQWKQITYTVTFIDFDNRVLSTQTVIKGDDAKAPQDPEQAGYVFDGWDSDFTNVTTNLTVKATYVLLCSITIDYGDHGLPPHGRIIMDFIPVGSPTPQLNQPPAESGWRFIGWSPAPTATVTQSITYTAQWELITVPPTTYVVTFAPGDHGTFTQQFMAGLLAGDATPAAPQTDGESGWQFVGWQPALAPTVTGDVTYVAQWQPVVVPPLTYTITYAPGTYGSGVMPAVTVNSGGLHTVLANSFAAQPGYIFSGWIASGAVSGSYDAGTSFAIFGNVTLTAQWEPVVVPPTTYTVTFVDYDNRVLSTQSITAGNSALAPVNPVRQGFTFTGWDTVFTDVTTNLTVKATYDALPTHTVTFLDHNGTPILTQTVTEGSSATPPVPPSRPGYTFTGWDTAFDNVTSSLIVQAIYTVLPPTTYTVVFVDHDDTILSTQSVTEGSDAVAPSDPVRTGYTFTGWDRSFTNVTTNLTVKTTYTVLPPITYTVVFVDHDDNTLSTQNVIAGTSATAPANPTRQGYVFVGWDKPFNNITSSITVKATYVAISPVTYTVTFISGDHGNFAPQVTTGLFAGDTTPTPPQYDALTSWRFVGWQPAVASYVTGDATYTAQWELVATPPNLGTPTQQPNTQVPPAQNIVVNPGPTRVGTPTTNVTVQTPEADAEQDSSTNNNTANTNDTDAANNQTALPDDDTPLAGGADTDTTDEAAGPNLLIFLLAALSLIVMVAGGWLLLRRARY